MKKELNQISNNLINIILFEMEHSLSNSLSQTPKILLEGFITKAVGVKGSNQFNYTFTDKSKKNSIKCLIKPEPTIDEFFQYPITLAKYVFDYLLILNQSSKNELRSNLLLIIETYSMPSNDSESGQFIMKIPKNVNYDQLIQQKIKERLDMQIKKLLNEYHYKAFSSNTQQINFLIGIMPLQRNDSLFKIACDVFKVDTKGNDNNYGLLLLSRKKIEYPLDYFVSEDQASLEYLKTLDWKALLEKSVTLNQKTNDGIELYHPSVININMNELKGNNFEKEKKNFLSHKTKRDTTTKEDKELYPNQITNLINSYGDLQANIGQSIISKYLLYKKYMAIVEDEKEVKSKY